MLSRFSRLMTRHPTVITAIAVLLLIPSAFGYARTRVNYNILSYLPERLDSVKGERVLEDTFHDAATSMLVIDGMEGKDVSAVKEKIKRIPGVNSCVWVDDLADLSVPKEMLPDAVQDLFYSGKSTLLLITYDESSTSESTFGAIAQIKKLLNRQCYLGGLSAMLKDLKDLVDRELPSYIALAFSMSLVAMILCMESWLLPFIFLLDIGFAIAYNMGTNFFLGEISYITKAIAAILQLGVTLDFSIFLINRYDEEKDKFADRRDAMAHAIEATFMFLSSSSLTTVTGFLALCFMELTLGRDIGIVMMKGVIFSMISTVMIQPSLILLFDKPIHKYTHRVLAPSFDRGSSFLIRHRKALLLLLVLTCIPAYWAQANTPVYYDMSRTLPSDLPSVAATDKLKKEFNMATTHFILLDDGLPAYRAKELTGRIEKLDGVETVLSYGDLIGPAVPDEFIPQSIRDICKKAGRQLVMVNSSYLVAEDAENEQIAKMVEIAKQYDPTAQVTGEAALTKDLIEIADHDFTVTGYISSILMILIVGIAFRSFAVPLILVAIIDLAIAINLGIPAFTGESIPFISPIVINCIQLGATDDYAILIMSRFQEELKAGRNRLEAAKIASATSFKSILSSALVFFCATTGVSWISKMDIIRSICGMLARGAIISAVVIILFLPAVLYLTEPLIEKTSFHFRSN